MTLGVVCLWVKLISYESSAVSADCRHKALIEWKTKCFLLEQLAFEFSLL